MTTMIYLYSRLFFERQKREFFEKVKIAASKNEKTLSFAKKLIENSNSRKKEFIIEWMNKIKSKKKREEGVKKLVEGIKGKICYVF